jgi:hypothetical protein
MQSAANQIASVTKGGPRQKATEFLLDVQNIMVPWLGSLYMLEYLVDP